MTKKYGKIEKLEKKSKKETQKKAENAKKKTAKKKEVQGKVSEAPESRKKGKKVAALSEIGKKNGKKHGKAGQGKKHAKVLKVSEGQKLRDKNAVIYTGTLVTNRKGFGFVECDGLSEDIFISHSGLHNAFHKDTVEVKAYPGRGGRLEGEITKILERAVNTVVGTYQEKRGFGFVVPDDQKIANDIHISRVKAHGAYDGCKVVVLIQEYGGEGKKPEGEVVEVLGRMGDPHVDITSVVRSYGLHDVFSEEIAAALEKVPEKVRASERKGRRDLRDVQMVTIDGEDTKDIDDAVSLEKVGRDYILGVHIADVSHYVKEGTVLDREALERGTSVYLADRVIPMLPQKLSNGICSLNEGVERLAMSCIMRMDSSGKLKNYEITESVIKVDRRMTYTAVAAILEKKDRKTVQEYKELVPMFKQMAKLAGKLKDLRTKRGSIDFNLPESQIVLDQNGHTTDIVPHERNIATDMIEQFMLSANETVAGHIHRQNYPFLYRVHETPDADRILSLMELLQSFGYYMKGDAKSIQPKEIQKLLAGMEGQKEEDLVRSLALRSMKQARYDTECLGHFGLAVQEYSHFTSPIRRYPDLQIHRILKEEMHGKLSSRRVAHYEKLLPKVAKQCSQRERRAIDAERDTNKLKYAEYMERHIGEEYDGQISGVTGWGIYVQLDNTVEGMIPIAKMPGDDYDYSEKDYAVVGRWTGKKFRLGERIRIKVADVDMVLRTIDFALVL